jgi:ABC-2 type transport system permease protein
MLQETLFVSRKDLQYMLRARETLLWVFFMPIVFFFFIGNVTGGMARSGGTGADPLLLEVGESPGFLLDRLVRRLEERDYTIVRADTVSHPDAYGLRLQVPAAFTDSVLAGRPVRLQLSHTREGLGADYDVIRSGRAVYTLLADVLVSGEPGRPLAAGDLAALDSLPRPLGLEVTQAGQRKSIPTGFEQAIPGIMVMFILMVMCTSGAVLLVIERRQGLLRRLACTPLRRLAVVLGKWGGKLGLGVIQIAFAMLAGTVLFRMNWGPDLGWVILVLVVYAAMLAALGLLLGSLARTEGMAVAIGVIAANVLAALGGCWWPIEITPPWMQTFALFLPTGWAMDAMHKLISFGAGPVSVVPHLVGMTLVLLILLAAATRAFRYE